MTSQVEVPDVAPSHGEPVDNDGDTSVEANHGKPEVEVVVVREEVDSSTKPDQMEFMKSLVGNNGGFIHFFKNIL